MKYPVSKELLALKDMVFKGTAYDIRGYVGERDNFFSQNAVITPQILRAAGIIMGSLEFVAASDEVVKLNAGDFVVVGYDNGPTSKILADAFSGGLVSQGVNVYDVGIASSGQVYHNQIQLKAQGHVQITRSHVEVTTNGAKFGIGNYGIHTYLLQQMNDAVVSGTIGRDTVKQGIIYDRVLAGRKLYYEKIIKRYGAYFKAHPRKIAVNLFGGTGLQYKDLFLNILGKETVILGDTIDVNSGDLLADPTRKEMLGKVPGLKKALQEGMRVHSFDLDSDRGALTVGGKALEVGEKGHYLGDDLAFILAEYKINKTVPALISKLVSLDLDQKAADTVLDIATTFYMDPRYTGAITAHITQLGGKPAYHCKGHSLWKETMNANIAKIASLCGFASIIEFQKFAAYVDMQLEASLHMFLTDIEDGVARDDAIENVFLFEMILDELNITSLHAYYDNVPTRYTTKEIRTSCVSNQVKEDVTTSIINDIRHFFAGYEMVEFDGQIRVDWETGFIMYGMSNTSPKLTFMTEGSTIVERNIALAFILALHNRACERFANTIPMDIKENSFFKDDNTFDMAFPDRIGFDDARTLEFIKQFNLKV